MRDLSLSQDTIIHDIISISSPMYENTVQTFGRFGAPLGIYTTDTARPVRHRNRL